MWEKFLLFIGTAASIIAIASVGHCFGKTIGCQECSSVAFEKGKNEKCISCQVELDQSEYQRGRNDVISEIDAKLSLKRKGMYNDDFIDRISEKITVPERSLIEENVVNPKTKSQIGKINKKASNEIVELEMVLFTPNSLNISGIMCFSKNGKESGVLANNSVLAKVAKGDTIKICINEERDTTFIYSGPN